MALQLVGGRTFSDIRGRVRTSLFRQSWLMRAKNVVPVTVLGLLSGWLAWSLGDLWKVALVGVFAATMCGFCIDGKPSWVASWFGCAFWLGQVLALNQILDSASTVSSFVLSLVAFNFVPIAVWLGAFVGYFAREKFFVCIRGSA